MTNLHEIWVIEDFEIDGETVTGVGRTMKEAYAHAHSSFRERRYLKREGAKGLATGTAFYLEALEEIEYVRILDVTEEKASILVICDDVMDVHWAVVGYHRDDFNRADCFASEAKFESVGDRAIEITLFV